MKFLLKNMAFKMDKNHKGWWGWVNIKVGWWGWVNINVAGQNAKWCSCSGQQCGNCSKSYRVTYEQLFSQACTQESWKYIFTPKLLQECSEQQYLQWQKNKQKKKTKSTTNGWITKQNMVGRAIQWSIVQPQNHNMDQPWKLHAKCEKPVTKDHWLYDSIDMKCHKEANP